MYSLTSQYLNVNQESLIQKVDSQVVSSAARLNTEEIQGVFNVVDVREAIGKRGESIFRVLITRKHPSRGYLFDKPRFLGEKSEKSTFT